MSVSLVFQACSFAAVDARAQSAGGRPLAGELRLGGAPRLPHPDLRTPTEPDSVLGAKPGPASTVQRQQHGVTLAVTQTQPRTLRGGGATRT